MSGCALRWASRPALILAIEKLNEDIGIPTTLKEIGLDASDGPGVVEYALADLAHRGNAKPATQADYEKIYEAALG